MNDISFFFVMCLVLFYFGCATRANNTADVENRLFRGRLRVAVADNFEHQIARVNYHLVMDGDGKKQLLLKFLNPQTIPNATSGTPVEILGRQRDGHIDVITSRILSNPK